MRKHHRSNKFTMHYIKKNAASASRTDTLRRVCPDATKHKNREKKCDDRFGVQVDRGGGAIQSDVG